MMSSVSSRYLHKPHSPSTHAQGSSSKGCEPLNEALIRRQSRSRILFVTFADIDSIEFAVNWARQLQSIGLMGLIGSSAALGARDVEAIYAAGSRIFCTTGALILRNGQAGRWAEVPPLLRYGQHVVVSDADIAWLRDPRSYFMEVHRRHPALDFLLCTDRAFNGYERSRLWPNGTATKRVKGRWQRHVHAGARGRLGSGAQEGLRGNVGGGGAADDVDDAVDGNGDGDVDRDLELEDGPGSAIPSYNIGILVLYAHAAANLSAMLDVLWVDAVSRPTKNHRGQLEAMRVSDADRPCRTCPAPRAQAPRVLISRALASDAPA